MNQYRKLKQRQQDEVNAFPMKFAFNDKQFKQSMEELGLTEHDTDKVYSIGAGGFIRKEDSKAYGELLRRLDEEMQAAIDSDKTGEGFIKDMFLYELNNHEYSYSYDLDPALDALGLSYSDIENSPSLSHGLKLARKLCIDE